MSKKGQINVGVNNTRIRQKKTCLHLGKSRFKPSLFIVPSSNTFKLSAVYLSVTVVPVDCRGTWKINSTCP